MPRAFLLALLVLLACSQPVPPPDPAAAERESARSAMAAIAANQDLSDREAVEILCTNRFTQGDVSNPKGKVFPLRAVVTPLKTGGLRVEFDFPGGDGTVKEIAVLADTTEETARRTRELKLTVLGRVLPALMARGVREVGVRYAVGMVAGKIEESGHLDLNHLKMLVSSRKLSPGDPLPGAQVLTGYKVDSSDWGQAMMIRR